MVEGLFPEGMIEDMFSAYCQLLRMLAADEAAWQMDSLPLLPQHQLIKRIEANSTSAPIDQSLLHELFERQARTQPHQPAIIFGDRQMSYLELDHRSKALAAKLRKKGARPNRLVAVVMQKGWEQVVAVLGVVRSGAAYLPIDPDLPRERIWYLLEQGEVEIALTQPWVDEALQWPEGVQRLVVEEGDGIEQGEQGEQQWERQKADDLAYVIFTSGSTGVPKGVMIDHRGAVNTIRDINERFAVGAGDRVLAVSSLSFDLSVYDIFGMLGAGATIVMVEEGRKQEAGHWVELIREQG